MAKGSRRNSPVRVMHRRDSPLDPSYDGLFRALSDRFERKRCHQLAVGYYTKAEHDARLFRLVFSSGKIGGLKPNLKEGWRVMATANYPIGEVVRVEEELDEVWVRRYGTLGSRRFESPIQFLEPDFEEKLREWLELQSGRPLPELLGYDQASPTCLVPDETNLLSGLRESQVGALRMLRTGTHKIWGPPGTGKTHTLARAAIALVKSGYRVCLSAPTNVAADNATLAIHRACRALAFPMTPGHLVRAGWPVLPALEEHPELLAWREVLSSFQTDLETVRRALDRLSTELRRSTDEKRKLKLREERESLRYEQRQIESRRSNSLWQLTSQARIVVGTVHATLNRPEMGALLSHPKVAVIIDEAGMVARYNLYPILELLSGGEAPQGQLRNPPSEACILLGGDPRQLGPIHSDYHDDPNARFWLGDSLLEEMAKADPAEIQGQPGIAVLCQQSRMDISICDRVSKAFYSGVLETLPDPQRPAPPLVNRWPRDGVVVLDPRSAPLPASVDPAGLRRAKKFDERSLQVAVTLIHQALKSGAGSVLWLTPFRDQAMRARKLAKFHFSDAPVRAGTVHTSQGSEADLVIFDPVSPRHRWLQGIFGDVEDIHRLVNVAISRARGQVIVLGNRNELRHNEALWKVLHDAEVWES